jgi:hypothetical protein
MGQNVFHRGSGASVIFIIFWLILFDHDTSLAQGIDFGNPAAPPPSAEFGPVASPLGDLWGLRETPAKYGVTLSGIYTGEVFANVNGGKQTGAISDGLLRAGP